MPSLDDLEARVRALEDIEAIRNLKARYCHYCDIGWQGAGQDPELARQLFAEDAMFDTKITGRIVGADAIAAMLEESCRTMKLALHLTAGSQINVDGDTATGLWHSLNALTTEDGTALWSAGTYVEEYRRTTDGWKISSIEHPSAFIAPHLTGWAER